jgi:hypothetical protein
MTRITQTTPATRWESYTSFPRIFNKRFPKAIMVNADGVVTLEDSEGNQVSFTLVGGVVYQLRPTSIVSTAIAGGAGPVIGLFD